MAAYPAYHCSIISPDPEPYLVSSPQPLSIRFLVWSNNNIPETGDRIGHYGEVGIHMQIERGCQAVSRGPSTDPPRVREIRRCSWTKLLRAHNDLAGPPYLSVISSLLSLQRLSQISLQ